MAEDAVVVRRRKVAGVLKGEPWIYPNAVASAPDEAGFYPVVFEDDGEHLGWADYNPAAPVRGRLLSRDGDWAGDEVVIPDLMNKAINRRLHLGYQLQGGAFRMINGEGDGLSGLVIDCFGRHLVVDCYSAGMRGRAGLIAEALGNGLSDCPVHVRMGGDAARREGVTPLSPEAAAVDYAENGVLFSFELGADQKSGGYLDQRDNRRLITNWAGERRVLDLFCYHGGFGLSCMAAGARSALCVDSSEAAIAATLANAERNGIDVDGVAMDVFDGIESLAEVGPFDLIVCDPPKLAPNKRSKTKALKAYRFLVDRCLRLLEVGGVLLVASCSQAIDAEDLRKLLEQQAKKISTNLDVIAVTGHPPDHPWPVGFTTGRYLSAIAVERRGPW